MMTKELFVNSMHATKTAPENNSKIENEKKMKIGLCTMLDQRIINKCVYFQ